MNNRQNIILIIISFYLIGCWPQEAPIEPSQKGGSEIAIGFYPEISSDGNKIAYVRENSIYVADSSGKNEFEIFHGRFYGESLRWAPDDNSVCVILADTINWRDNKIISVNITTKTIVILTPNISVVGYDWSWNNSGSKIACWTTDYSEYKTYLTIISGDGSSTILKKYRASEYSWSPDGSKIAFLSVKKDYYDTMYLYIANINADSFQSYISYDRVLSSVRWSPNPNIISVHLTYKGLILYDINNKVELDTFYVRDPQYPDNPSYQFSPDGSKIAYVYFPYSSNPDAIIYSTIYCIDISSNIKKQIVIAYPGISRFSWFPSSKEIIYAFNEKIYKAKVE